MALRKNQLRKMQLEEIMELVQKEIDSDNIKLIHTFVQEKNEALAEKKALLLAELEKVRKGVEKGVYNLNVAVLVCRTGPRTGSTRRRRYSWIRTAAPKLKT
jgi:ferritin